VHMGMFRQAKPCRVGNLGERQRACLAMANKSAMQSWWKAALVQCNIPDAGPDFAECSRF
jgi:hypothetical protein